MEAHVTVQDIVTSGPRRGRLPQPQEMIQNFQTIRNRAATTFQKGERLDHQVQHRSLQDG